MRDFVIWYTTWMSGLGSWTSHAVFFFMLIMTVMPPLLLWLLRIQRDAWWVHLLSSYLLSGLFFLALPLKYLAVPATNALGVAYLTVIWPAWLLFDAAPPLWLTPYMFDT